MKIYSWNVNSLRSCEPFFLEFISNYNPDIILIQELRAHPDQISMFLKSIDGYKHLFNDSGRPGYGGTAIYYKKSLSVKNLSKNIDDKILDSEGRVIYIQVNDIHIYNFYTPNGNSSEERLKYKLKYYDELLNLARRLVDEDNKVILGGDLNVAYTELDQYIKKNNVSGCLPVEREWFKDVLNSGYFDTFRKFEKRKSFYTWWSFRDKTRKENKGWRYDYFLASKNINNQIVDAGILKDVFGSDHCPIFVEIDV